MLLLVCVVDWCWLSPVVCVVGCCYVLCAVVCLLTVVAGVCCLAFGGVRWCMVVCVVLCSWFGDVYGCLMLFGGDVPYGIVSIACVAVGSCC